MPYLTTRKKLKLELSPGLVASYDIQPGNEVGLFWDTTHTPDPHGGPHSCKRCVMRFAILSNRVDVFTAGLATLCAGFVSATDA